MKKLTAVKVEKARYTPTKSEGGKNPGALLGNRISDSNNSKRRSR